MKSYTTTLFEVRCKYHAYVHIVKVTKVNSGTVCSDKWTAAGKGFINAPLPSCNIWLTGNKEGKTSIYIKVLCKEESTDIKRNYGKTLMLSQIRHILIQLVCFQTIVKSSFFSS